jgi:hypothetical protein
MIGDRLLEHPLPLISHRVTREGVQTLGVTRKVGRPTRRRG